MRTLQSVPNIGGPTTAYPNGVIIDQTGETGGTGVTEILYGDLIQTVHKLKRLAAITENNLPDNETNGFQVLTALLANCLPTWQAPAANADFSKTKWVSYANGVYYHKTAVNTTNNPSVDGTNWALVFYWNGTKIVFSDENRLAGIEAGLANTYTQTQVKDYINNVVRVDITPISGYTLPDSTYGLFLNVNNKVVTLYYRVLIGSPTFFHMGVVPFEYRPPLNTVVGVASSGILLGTGGVIASNGRIEIGDYPPGTIVTGTQTWVIN